MGIRCATIGLHYSATDGLQYDVAMNAASETVLPVGPDEAWEAVTDPDHLKEWLGEDVRIELEPGGDIEVRDGDEQRSGFVEEVDAPRRLVFWWSEPDEESSRVEIDLEPEGGDTRIRVVESRPLEHVEEFVGPQMQACAA